MEVLKSHGYGGKRETNSYYSRVWSWGWHPPFNITMYPMRGVKIIFVIVLKIFD
jgi:hypothetical protein